MVEMSAGARLVASSRVGEYLQRMAARSFGSRLLRGIPRHAWSSASTTRSIVKTVVFVVVTVALAVSPDLSERIKGYSALRWTALLPLLVLVAIAAYRTSKEMWEHECARVQQFSSGNLALRDRLKALRAEQNEVEQALRAIDKLYIEFGDRRLTLRKCLETMSASIGAGLIDADGFAQFYANALSVEEDRLQTAANVHLGMLVSIGVLVHQELIHTGTTHRFTACVFTEFGSRVMRRLLDEVGPVTTTVQVKRARPADDDRA